MKLRISMKCPDALDEAISEAYPQSSDRLDSYMVAAQRRAARDYCGRWLRYGEYLTVEIDTEAGTATVCPV